ncbi:hypothetical protein ERJ75_000756000 [Trypanosoma vivax]|uniref:RNA-editing complex protein n=1 Tax=Trypanosoma vivax (strain Y486) TaxID=1055687 RepID=G0U010_TRYVY|nr:RNA-editing complex protein [Trypanosoma vivax]KAH8613932.1 hypothetical protein ERJ75_000756000 [Trypanosoma vivax]CCC49407.1 RNA-editing complex protein [Trypanosoma vivax Y486]
MFTLTLRRLGLRPLNRVTMVGAVHDVQMGLLEQKSVFQFALTCTVLNCNKNRGQSDGSVGNDGIFIASPTVKDTMAQCFDKEQYTVRCLGSEAYAETLRDVLDEGSIVRVVGRLKTVETADGGKKRLFPCIIVEQGRAGGVTLLHAFRKQRNDWKLQNALDSLAASQAT